MKNLLVVLGGILSAGFLILTALLPMPTEMSMSVGVLTILAIVVLGFIPGSQSRLAFCLLCTWIVLHYLFWRYASLPLQGDMMSAVFAVALYAAEIYGGMMLLTGLFVNAQPLNRKSVPLPKDKAEWPTIDIYIPTYSENMDVVRPTLLGALTVDYPKDKFNVYVLDDGAPRAANPNTPAEQAIELEERANALKALCAQYGATYLTRPDNSHAKSGNLNSALKQTKGEYILVLDADHVPTRDILVNMAGHLAKHSNLAFVQSPHNFLNDDPFEKNQDIRGRMPAENDMFYRAVQKGLDFWNTSFFCGSAALLRRKAIESVGGFSVDSITEDASTSVKMHSKGWHSAYVETPMVMGLQPESYAAFIVQRMRWGMGMAQIMVKQNPMLARGLSFAQRIAYGSVVLFWLFPFARLVFFLAPIPALVFDLTVYPVGKEVFLAFTLPYMFAVMASFYKMFGKYRATFVSEVYETLQAPYLLPGLISAFFNPNKPTFKVTPKGEQYAKVHLSEMHMPLTICTGVAIAVLGWGVYRLFETGASNLALLFTLAWQLFNVTLLVISLGVLVEQPQLRRRPWVLVNERAELLLDDGTVQPVVIEDINEYGAAVKGSQLPDHKQFVLRLNGQEGTVVAKLLKFPDPAGRKKAIVMFDADQADEQLRLVSYIYGSSSRWEALLNKRENKRGFFGSLWQTMGLAYDSAGRFLRTLQAEQDDKRN